MNISNVSNKALEKEQQISPFVVKKRFIDHKALAEVCSLASSVSGSISSVNDIAVNILGDADESEFSGLKMDVNDIAMGIAMTTTGLLNIELNKNVAKTALKVGDTVGFIQSFTKMALLGPIGVVRGVVNTTKSSLGIVKDVKKIHHNIPKILKGLGLASFIGSSFCSTALAGISIANMVQIRSVAKAFKEKVKIGGNKAGFNYLKGMLSITPKESRTVLEDIFKPKEQKPWYKRGLDSITESLLGKKDSEEDIAFKEALQHITTDPQVILSLLNSIEVPVIKKALSRKELIIKAYLEKVFPDYNKLPPEIKRKLLHVVVHIHSREIENLKQKKGAIFNRTIGLQTRELIEPFLKKSAKQVPSKDLKEIIVSANKGIFENTVTIGAIISASILNIIVGAIAQALTGGVYFFIQLGLNLVISSVWLGIEGYELYKVYTEHHKDREHRLLIGLATVSMVIASVIVGTLANSVVNLITTSAITFVWLFLILYGMYGYRDAVKKEHLKTVAS